MIDRREWGQDGRLTPPSSSAPARATPKRQRTTPKADSAPRSNPAADLAEWVMHRADRHCANGTVTMNELRTFMPANHPFTDWIIQGRGNLLRHDTNHDGVLSINELYTACSEFLKQTPSFVIPQRCSCCCSVGAEHS